MIENELDVYRIKITEHFWFNPVFVNLNPQKYPPLIKEV
jgi:hypothetical protein